MPTMLTLTCRLNRNDALVFTNIIVTPFLNLTNVERQQLDERFDAGHIADGTYYLAAFPDKGPRAIMKNGFVNDIGVYSKDIDRSKANNRVYFDSETGYVGDILGLIETHRGIKRKVTEVWWFHSSPQADLEWHTFMKTFAQQINEHIFFVPIKPKREGEAAEFRKPPGSDLVTMMLDGGSASEATLGIRSSPPKKVRWWEFWK